MSIKKEYVAFHADGYQHYRTFKDKKPTRAVSILVRDKQSNSFLELTIDEAKQAIKEIEKAIKDSKKKGNTPF